MAMGFDTANSKILVVDDEIFSLSIVTRILRDLSCPAIVEAQDGSAAIALLNQGENPDLSILDFNMPEMNGLQVLKAVRTGKTKLPRDHRIFMLTGNRDFGLVRAAMELDVDAFIFKPASKDVLATRLLQLAPENAELKPAADYETVDIEAVNKRFLGQSPAKAAPVMAAREPEPSARERCVPFDQVQPGAVLARHIRGPAGELIIGRATILSERTLRRLNELREAMAIDHVYVMLTAAEQASTRD